MVTLVIGTITDILALWLHRGPDVRAEGLWVLGLLELPEKHRSESRRKHVPAPVGSRHINKSGLWPQSEGSKGDRPEDRDPVGYSSEPVGPSEESVVSAKGAFKSLKLASVTVIVTHTSEVSFTVKLAGD